MQILILIVVGMNESVAEDSHIPVPTLPTQATKMTRPSLAKIILSQETDLAKQQALGYVLTALQITYARYVYSVHVVIEKQQHRVSRLNFLCIIKKTLIF